MFHVPKREIAKIAILAIICGVIAAIIAQCSMATSAGAAENAQPVVTVERLPLAENGQPRVRVATTKRIALLFSKPRSDSTEDDLVYQKPGTVTYRLPKVKRGTIARWFVTAYNPRNGYELFDQRYNWRRYQRELVGLSAFSGSRSTDVYAEIHPKKGGMLRVKSVRVRVISRSGNIRWLDLVHAYTDEERGVRIYVRTVRAGVGITDVDARTLYGKLMNVSAHPVG